MTDVGVARLFERAIEFRRLGPDVKGDIFEYLLTHLGQSALNGQFRTPKQIRAFMVAMTASFAASGYRQERVAMIAREPIMARDSHAQSPRISLSRIKLKAPRAASLP
jgi:hypothetical protein